MDILKRPDNKINITDKFEQVISKSPLRAPHLISNSSLKNESFPINDFKFFSNNHDFQTSQFKHDIHNFQTHKEKKVNKKWIKQTIMKLIFNQLMFQIEQTVDENQIDNEKPYYLQHVFPENKMRWCQILIRSQQIQDFHHQFSDRLYEIVNHEINKNKEVFNMYIKQPSQPLQNLSSPRKIGTIKLKNSPINIENLQYFEVNQKKQNDIEQQVQNGIDVAKFNYKKQKREQKKKQMQLTGSLKYLRQTTESPKRNQVKFQAKSDSDLKSMKEHEQKESPAIQQLKQGKYRKILLTEFQLQVEEKSKNIDNLIQSFVKNHEDIMNQVESFKDDFQEIQNEKIENGQAQKVPGAEIQKFISDWDDEPLMYDENLLQKCMEPWIGLKELEQQILEEEKGYKLLFELNSQRHVAKINHIQNVTSMRIQALESALSETKQKQKVQIERLQMTISELESKQLNKIVTQKLQSDIMKNAIDGIKFQKVTEARDVINDLMKVMKSKDTEIESFKNQMIEQKKYIETHDDRIKDRETFYLEQNRLRIFYQKTLMKMIRDLKLFENDKEKQKMFEILNESDDDLQYQRQVQVILDRIQLQDAINDHVNKHFSQGEGIKKIYQNMQTLNDLENERSLTETDDLLLRKKKKSNKILQQANEMIQKTQEALKDKILLAKMEKEKVENQETEEVKVDPIKDVQKQMNALLDQVIQGKGGPIIATKFSGVFKHDQSNSYKSDVVNIIKEIDPQQLQDFRFQLAQKMESMVKLAFEESQEQKNVQQESSQKEDKPKTKKAFKGGMSFKSSKNIDIEKKKTQKEKQENDQESSKKDDKDEKKKSKNKKNDEIQSKQQITEESSESDSIIEEIETEIQKPVQVKQKQEISEGKKVKLNQEKNKPQSLKIQKMQSSVQPKKLEIVTHKQTIYENEQDEEEEQEGSDQEDEIQQFSEQSEDLERINTPSLTSLAEKQQKIKKHLIKSINPGNSSKLNKRNIKNLSQFNKEDSQSQKMVIKENDEKKNTNESISGDDEALDDYQEEEDNDQNQEIQEKVINSPMKKEEKSKNIQQKKKDEPFKMKEKQSSKPEPNAQSKTNKLQLNQQTSLNKNAPAKKPAKEPFSNTLNVKKDSPTKIQTTNLEQYEDQQIPEQKGIHVVFNQIQNLFDEKYMQHLEEVKEEVKEDPKSFRMTAWQLHQMQEVAQLAFIEEFSHDYLMNDLYKAEVPIFFDVLNQRLLNKFNLTQCYNVYQNQGVDQERIQKLEEMNTKEKEAFLEKEQNYLLKVNFGNLMKPHFSEEGELMGFDIRHELMNMMLLYNNMDHEVMKRSVRTVCFLNRLIQDGIKEDFNLTIGLDNSQNFLKLRKIDVDIQVDVRELKEFGMGDALTPRSQIQKLFKDHLLKILNRPFAEKKENLNKITILDLDDQQLLDYEIEEVYQNDLCLSSDEYITFEGYLFTIFNQIQDIIESLDEQKSKQLIVGQILMGTGVKLKKNQANKGIQAIPEVSNKSFETSFDLLTAYMGEKGNQFVKNSINQQTLDLEIEKEFKKTLKIMDQFADQIQKIEIQTQKTLHKQKVREEQLVMTAIELDDDYEIEKEKLNIKKKIFFFEDQIEELKEKLQIMKIQKEKMKEQKQLQIIEQNNAEVANKYDKKNKKIEKQKDEIQEQERKVKMELIKKVQASLNKSKEEIQGPEFLQMQINFIRQNPTLYYKFNEMKRLNPNIDDHELVKMLESLINSQDIDLTQLQQNIKDKNKEQDQLEIGKEQIIKYQNKFKFKQFKPYIPQGLEKRLLDQRLMKHKEFNKYMKLKLNQLEFRSNKVQIYYKELFQEIDENEETDIPNSYGFSKHFGESQNQKSKYLIPNVLKNIYNEYDKNNSKFKNEETQANFEDEDQQILQNSDSNFNTPFNLRKNENLNRNYSNIQNKTDFHFKSKSPDLDNILQIKFDQQNNTTTSLLDSDQNFDSRVISENEFNHMNLQIINPQDFKQKQNQTIKDQTMNQTSFQINKFPIIKNLMGVGQSLIFQNQQFSTNDFSLASTNPNNKSSINQSKNFIQDRNTGLSIQKSLNYKLSNILKQQSPLNKTYISQKDFKVPESILNKAFKARNLDLKQFQTKSVSTSLSCLI